MNDIRIVIVTGLSGAGKTQAIWAFEDLGYFCVDNLPPTLIPKFAELCNQSDGKISKIALVIDIRGGDFFHSLFDALENLEASGIKYEILFLEASDSTLVRRFKETRRSHPLRPEGPVLEGIKEERRMLLELRGRANKIIDTSNTTSQQLKAEINRMFSDEHKEHHKLRITVMSFGFKYGIPLDADLAMDVRFLPNPYYVEELRSLTGNDVKVQEFVHSSPVTKKFLRKFYSLIKFLIPQYIKEGKTNLVVAIGCTGGQHRSVTLANKIGQLLDQQEHPDYSLRIKHRDAALNSGKETRNENH